MNSIWLFVLAIPVGLGLSYFLNRGTVNALTPIAEKHQGRVSSGWYFGTTELTIPYRGLTLHIIPYINTRRSSIGDPSIQATLKLDAPHLPELSLSRYSPVLLKRNSEDPIPTGDEEFDRLFVVHGSDTGMVKKVFTHGVMEKLKNEKLRGASFIMEPDKFVMSGYCNGLDSQAYEAFTDAALAVLDQAWS
jgi:hypothetical protein